MYHDGWDCRDSWAHYDDYVYRVYITHTRTIKYVYFPVTCAFSTLVCVHGHRKLKQKENDSNKYARGLREMLEEELAQRFDSGSAVGEIGRRYTRNPKVFLAKRNGIFFFSFERNRVYVCVILFDQSSRLRAMRLYSGGRWGKALKWKSRVLFFFFFSYPSSFLSSTVNTTSLCLKIFKIFQYIQKVIGIKKKKKLDFFFFLY